jgi:RNA-directed DNA polymerase
MTHRHKGQSLRQRITPLSQYLRGWRGYFGFCQTPSVLADLDSWIRRRLRAVVLRHWPRGKRRFAELTKRGVGKDLSAQTAASSQGPWRLSRSPALSFALPNHFWDRLGVERVLLKE